jgi:hypothetical protein
MKTESFIRVLAGTFILLSIALTLLHSMWWLVFTGFIGLNLIQSAFTGFCPPTLLLEKLHRVRPDGTINWRGQS